MFLLSKILPLLVLPVGLILLLLLWAALSGRRAPVIAAFALLWIFATPLTAEGLWRWLERPYQRRTAALVETSPISGPRPRRTATGGGVEPTDNSLARGS